MKDPLEEYLKSLPSSIPYDVNCARCGKTMEEGDEWECPECNDRCNEVERYNAEKCREEHGI